MIDIDDLVRRAGEPLNDVWLNELATIHGDSGHCHFRFLYRLALELEPPVALELGVQWGITSGHLCAAARQYGGQVVGVDIQTHPRPAEELNQRYGNYTFLHMDTRQAVSYVDDLVDEYGPLELVYQDSSHDEGFEREWADYAPLLGERAVWVCNLMPRGGNDAQLLDYWEGIPAREKHVYRDCLYVGAPVGVAVL